MSFSTLLIDLDDTIYPADSGVWMLIRQRIDLYVMEKFSLPLPEARELRHRLFLKYGTTMRGLQAEYHVDEDEYLAFVHDVPLKDYLRPNPDLCRVLQVYPQRKAIFTNADVAHARRVLEVLGLTACFATIIDIKAMAPYCKPMQEAFQIAMRIMGESDPGKIVLVDDQPKNVQAARAVGMKAIRMNGPELDPAADATIQSLQDLIGVLPVDGE